MCGHACSDAHSVLIDLINSPHVSESANHDSGIQEKLLVETRINLKESGIPPTIRIQNPSSTDKNWNPVRGIRNPRHAIQNSRLSWIPYIGDELIVLYFYMSYDGSLQHDSLRIANSILAWSFWIGVLKPDL